MSARRLLEKIQSILIILAICVQSPAPCQQSFVNWPRAIKLIHLPLFSGEGMYAQHYVAAAVVGLCAGFKPFKNIKAVYAH